MASESNLLKTRTDIDTEARLKTTEMVHWKEENDSTWEKWPT